MLQDICMFVVILCQLIEFSVFYFFNDFLI